MAIYYINTQEHGKIETLDQFDSRNDADEKLIEYQLTSHNSCYVSGVCSRDWSHNHLTKSFG